MKIFRVVLVLFAVGGLHGCATLSEDECHTADWYSIGYEDGVRGRPIHYIGEHRKACSKYGVTPSLDQYNLGHRDGLPKYCVASKGFSLASNGRSYPSACDARTFPGFERGFSAGKRAYRIYTDIKTLQAHQEELHVTLHDLEAEIKHNENLIVADSTQPRLRRELIRKNKDLEYQIEDIQVELSDIEQEIVNKERRIDAIKY